MISKTRALFASLVVTIAIPASCPAAQWRGIVPAQSTREQVIARLGKPRSEGVDRLEYADKHGQATIFFYTEQDTAELNLDPKLAGRVLTIYYYPGKPARYDLKRLRKKVVSVGRGVTIDGDVMTSYDDGEHGISYHFKKDDPHIWRIVYYAPREEFARYRLAPADRPPSQ